ncbi:F0F1 ATP synthase subunit delta [Fervidobacterium sp. 2310opik-2]|uniref:F0F1 ATP synthase subunit delta n=1 Tax=Fervidobacterium sp. 2310opik-2 TaxID=1755815 RepID=UPI0013DEF604|nr:F0F1 ATP synthase subunit delta [Fervidobacterium sp. 2310opik-2]KAF2961518.1 ATP synthase subunit delta [Fervidobacterium sp. 2310opik-2]
MMYSAIASKYALALYNISKTNGKTETYKELLNILGDIYNLASVYLNNQAIKPENRVQFVLNIMKELKIEYDEIFRKFINLLIVNKRLKYINQIISFFDYTILEDKGLIPVNVTSAMELSKEEEEILSKFVEKYTNRKPVFNVTVDDSLIAGVVMEFAGKTFDVTVKGRLQNIARNALNREG